MTAKETKYIFNSERQDYMTSQEDIIRPVLEFIGREQFFLDTCCSIKNIPAENYYIDGIKDGLSRGWASICWLNPPYNKTADWVKKAYHETQSANICEVWSIIPARTETAYWQKCIANNPYCFVVNLRKGVSFINPETNDYCKNAEGKIMPYKNPLAIVYFGKNAEECAKRWNIEQPLQAKAWRIAA